MRIRANRREGYKLLERGCKELSIVEANGIRIDVGLLQDTKRTLYKQIKKLRAELEEDEIWHKWRKRFAGKANMTSREQLATVLTDMGFKFERQTDSGRLAMDEEALAEINHPFTNKLLRIMKFEKALTTYLKGIEKEIVGDRIHPMFNLHTVRTFRSSSDSPNFQNQPVRDKEISKIIRQHFIASKNCVLVENDFKGIEVSISACYHKDPVFIKYITTSGKDMHRDMAAQIYCLSPEQVSKEARYGAKNKFVFPQFYGDYYLSCARNLWDWIGKGGLLGPDQKTDLFKHLRKKGIKELGACSNEKDPVPGTFEHHVKQVEEDFWNNRFKVYGQWRKDWYSDYLVHGFFDMLSGFRVHGYFRRNSVVNYPVQGSAFHCLLWSLCEVNRRLRKYKMRSKIVGQIHDSLIGDVHRSELRDYLEIVEQVTTQDIHEHYKWIIVPLQIEYEIVPPGKSWYEKREVQFKEGKFFHPDYSHKYTYNAQKFLKAL